MTYLTVQKESAGAQKLSLFEWLREFNPCGKIHYYALAAFNEGLCFDDVVIECQNAFNDISIENIKSIVMMVSRKYKSAKLN